MSLLLSFRYLQRIYVKKQNKKKKKKTNKKKTKKKQEKPQKFSILSYNNKHYIYVKKLHMKKIISTR